MRKFVLAPVMTLMLAGCQASGGGERVGGIPAAPVEVTQEQIGQATALHQKAITSGTIYAPGENPVATRYLDRIVARVAAQRPPGSVPLQAFIVKDDAVNAFTTGTGYLYFNRGLLAALENEAQVAMVVGHEAAHVDAGHLAQGNARAAQIDLATQIGAAVLDSVTGGIAGTVGKVGVGLAGRRANAAFSQTSELEADDIGFVYAARAGYDPREASRAFAVLARENGQQGRLAEFFSSHPSSQGRMNALAAKAGPGGGEIGREEHDRMRASFGAGG